MGLNQFLVGFIGFGMVLDPVSNPILPIRLGFVYNIVGWILCDPVWSNPVLTKTGFQIRSVSNQGSSFCVHLETMK